MRVIRMDDYPIGSYGIDGKKARETVAKACEVWNRNGITFLLGVSPGLLSMEDPAYLDVMLQPYGRAVMHGFTHAIDMGPLVWRDITRTWKHGGEFMYADHKALQREYALAHFTMQGIKSYDPSHFIAPFNVYTQELIDVLDMAGVKFLHTTDSAYKAYGYDKLKHRRITTIQAIEGKTYDFVDKVIDNFHSVKGQITLHWSMDDNEVPGWLDKYQELADLIKGEK